VRIALVSLMRIVIVLLIGTAVLPVVLPLTAQEKPRVFITPNATRRTQGNKSPSYEERITTIDDRTVEISRDFSESWKEVTVSAERRKTDYIVRLNRKIGRNQIAVYRTNGDLVGVADKSSIKGSVKATCELIKRDLPHTAATTEEKADPAPAR
jgi:hypothetical protein